MITALWFEASCVPYLYLKYVSISISNCNISLCFAITEWRTRTAHDVELTRGARCSIRSDNICQWISRFFNMELRISWTASSIRHIPLVRHGLYNISNNCIPNINFTIITKKQFDPYIIWPEFINQIRVQMPVTV